MIIKSRYKYTPTCDGCGTQLAPQYDYWDAAAMMRQEGWEFFKTDKICTEWYNLCPACKERRKKDG